MSRITRSIGARQRRSAEARTNRAMWRIIDSTSSRTMRDELIIIQQRQNGESV